MGGSEIQINEWLQRDVGSRANLAKAIQEQVKTDFSPIRKVAVEEGAKKTVAAIDGVLLDRQERVEKLIETIEGTRRGPRLIRGSRIGGLYGGQVPRGGASEPVQEETGRAPTRRRR